MMRMVLKINRNVIFYGALNRYDVFPRTNARAIADAEYMRINGLGWVSPPHIQNHIGGLAPHTGQRF